MAFFVTAAPSPPNQVTFILYPLLMNRKAEVEQISRDGGTGALLDWIYTKLGRKSLWGGEREDEQKNLQKICERMTIPLPKRGENKQKPP